MIQSIQKNVIRIQTGHPGRRFHDFYQYRQHQRNHRRTFASIATIVGGLIVTGMGLFLMPVPGPGGSVVTLLGLALLGSEFEFIARFLDWVERVLRPSYERAKKKWAGLKFWPRLIVGTAVTALIFAVCYGFYQLVFGK